MDSHFLHYVHISWIHVTPSYCKCAYKLMASPKLLPLRVAVNGQRLWNFETVMASILNVHVALKLIRTNVLGLQT